METERGRGNWPVDERLGFIECRDKLNKARKQVAHWRDNHKQAMAEIQRLRVEIERLKADPRSERR